jgi:predicted alpha/beta-hydrolase family hydrolase
MSQPESNTFKLSVSDEMAVTAKLDAPARPAPETPFLILAHGANNDLEFPLLAYLARRLAETARAAVVRFNFPYVERGVTSPDPRGVLESTFLSVYDHLVAELASPGAPIFVGGKSLGGRAAAELVSRRNEGSGLLAAGLIVLGYPLHAMGREDRLYVEPLRHIDIPSLFCIGSRDSLCNPELLRPLLADLVHPGTLYLVKGGDHSLHLSPAAGRKPEDSYEPVAQEVAAFIERTVS